MALSVEFAGAGNFDDAGVGSISSLSFTITSANKLIVALGFGDDVNVTATSLTWNGGASFHANRIAAADIYDGAWNQATFFYLDNPAAGTGVVTATTDHALGAIAVVTFIDATTGAPAGGEATGNSSSPSVTVAGSASGDIVVSMVVSDLGSSGTTEETSTSVYDKEDIGSDIDVNVQYQTATGANTVCSWSQSTADAYAAAAVAIAAAGATQSNAPRVTRHLQNMMRG